MCTNTWKKHEWISHLYLGPIIEVYYYVYVSILTFKSTTLQIPGISEKGHTTCDDYTLFSLFIYVIWYCYDFHSWFHIENITYLYKFLCEQHTLTHNYFCLISIMYVSVWKIMACFIIYIFQLKKVNTKMLKFKIMKL